jgi:uncharacterized protein (TIGR02145 family)
MKKYYFTIITILFFGLISCSDEETKTEKQSAARPTVPLQNGEVQIGNQIWMTKNLNVTRYRNGDPIPQITDPTQWANLTTGAWCYYYHDSSYGMVYGKLYNWYAVNDPRGLAPIGWHMPSDAEWTALTNFLGGENIAGVALKATTYWEAFLEGGNNFSGFTALPGGYVTQNHFWNIYERGLWWSSTVNNPQDAWVRVMSFDSNQVRREYLQKNWGMSVRCLRN